MLNKGVVEVFDDGTTVNAGRSHLQATELVRLLSVQEGGVSLGGKLGGASRGLPALSKDIVLVNEGSLILELIVDRLAWGRQVRWDGGTNVGEVASMGCVSIVEAVTNHTVVVRHGEIGGIAIVFPVGHTIADHEALEVGYPSVGVGFLGVVHPQIKSEGELGHVDAGIGLT